MQARSIWLTVKHDNNIEALSILIGKGPIRQLEIMHAVIFESDEDVYFCRRLTGDKEVGTALL